MNRGDFADRDLGAATVEFAIVFTAFMIFATLVLFAGRMAQATIDVGSAAQEAARAATLQRDPASAAASARTTAAAQFDANDCVGGPSVTIDTSNFQPGGWVTVTVSCSIAGVARIGGRTVTSSATEVVDTYRSGT